MHYQRFTYFARLTYAALIALSAPALAQPTPPEKSDGVDDVIMIGDRQADPILVVAHGAASYQEEITQSVTRLSQSDIERLQTTGIAELLATTPGVTFSRNGGIGGFSAVRLRGAEGEQTLVLIDGTKVNDPSSPGGGFDFGTLLADNISAIEIFRGPNSVPWGSDAMGGVVAIGTRRSGAGDGISARGEYGSFDRRRLSAHGHVSADSFSVSGNAGWFKEDGISAASNGTERDGSQIFAGTLSFAVDLTENIAAGANVFHVDSRVDSDGFPAPFFTLADTAEFAKAQHNVGSAWMAITLFDNGSDRALDNQIRYEINDINRDNFDPSAGVAPVFFARGRTERVEYQGDWRFDAPLRAIFGAEHERSRFSDGSINTRTGITSAYVQLIASDPDGHLKNNQLTFSAGMRYDDHRQFGGHWTLSLGANFRPTPLSTIRAAYGEGFKAPTLFQLNSFFGNLSLQPETARSYEIGFDQRLAGSHGQLHFSLFQRDTRNLITFISCFGSTTGICTNRPFGTYDNVGRSRSRGFELGFSIRPVDALLLDANYSFVESEDRTTGLALLRRPKHSLNLSLDWDVAKWLKLGTSLQMVSDSIDADFQTFARTSLDGFALAGLRAAVPVNDKIEFYGRVENLFDAEYETVSGYGSYGRNAHVGVRARF